MRLKKAAKNESGSFMGDGEYVVFSRLPYSKEWIREFDYDSLEEAEKEASRVSRNNHFSKVIDKKGKVVARFHDMFKESVRTDLSGGFIDCMKAVDKILETYYQGGQVEILVTDNGFATVTVFPKKGNDETVTVQLDYPNEKVILVDDNNNKKIIRVNIDQYEFGKLGDALISIIDSQLKTGEAISRDKARSLFSRTEEKENEDSVIVKVGNKWRIKGKKQKYWDAEYDTKKDAEAGLRAYWANKQ